MPTRLLQFAKSMRHRPTEAENAIWKMLRGSRLLGHKFKRQQPIGDYIVDFACFEHRLIIEIDGGQHTASTDRVRTAWLTGQGFALVRFWNDEVLGNPEGVFDTISRALRDNPSPQPLSHKGRGAKKLAIAKLLNADAALKPLPLDGGGVGERVPTTPQRSGKQPRNI